MRQSVLVYGGLMLAIGIIGYLATGLEHWTALIPAVLGALAIVVAFLRRGAPVVQGLAGLAIAAVALVGTAGALAQLPGALAGDAALNTAAVYARAATAVASMVLIAAVIVAWWRRRAGG